VYVRRLAEIGEGKSTVLYHYSLPRVNEQESWQGAGQTHVDPDPSRYRRHEGVEEEKKRKKDGGGRWVFIVL
jgi:hypothetical protein